MSQASKDSDEVVKFMTLFARLKDWSDDAPDDLAELAANDSSVSELCCELCWAALWQRGEERRTPEHYTVPVDPTFVAAWRDYEKRYELVVMRIWLSNVYLKLGTGKPPPKLETFLQWNMADDEAKEQAESIEKAIEFAARNADDIQRWIDADAQDYIQRVQEGLAAWNSFKLYTSFDLRGVFRRRALVPFVFVPRRLAAKHGSAETISMLKNLQQAHDAFVYGATYGALALMRSIMEAVLRDHYGAEGKDLSERIRNARSRLPREANEAALHRLRKLANAILHLDREKDEDVPAMDDVRLEKEIVSLLSVLRALIEGAT